MTQEKLCELTCDPSQMPWEQLIQLPKRQLVIRRAWLESQLTPSQINFLDRTNASYRPHPRSSKSQRVIEVFVDTDTLTEQDLVWATLLFDRLAG